jgi:2-polyprenyl-3-methyl-5-hydroxy-6-metoxy-1,4-benzoquinol methylase
MLPPSLPCPFVPEAYGESELTPIDRIGVWFSARRIRRSAGSFKGKRLGDFGCGFNAAFTRSVLDQVDHVTLVDIGLADDLKAHPKVDEHEGHLPDAVSSVKSESLDVALCISVVEHLWEPDLMLSELRRVTVPGGLCLISVPTWLDKRALEFSAFKLGLSTADSVADHKAYYNPRDLWPMLVRAGFRPEHIRCHRYKFGLNTFAECFLERK